MRPDPPSEALAGRSTRASGLKLAHIAGVDVHLDPSWGIIFLLVLWSLAAGYLPAAAPGNPVHGYWIAGVIASLLFFASILTHEMSHAIVAGRLGIATPAITLFLFGGVAQMEDEPRDPGTELRIAAVGPFTSFAI